MEANEHEDDRQKQSSNIERAFSNRKDAHAGMDGHDKEELHELEAFTLSRKEHDSSSAKLTIVALQSWPSRPVILPIYAISHAHSHTRSHDGRADRSFLSTEISHARRPSSESATQLVHTCPP